MLHSCMYEILCSCIYCMRFADPAEATEGSVGQRLGALRICKMGLGFLGGSWKKALRVLGGPSGVLGRPWGSMGGVFEGPWARL